MTWDAGKVVFLDETSTHTSVTRPQGRALAILGKAEAAGDLRTALAAIREARTVIETLLEVEGQLASRGRDGLHRNHRQRGMARLARHPG